MSVTGDWLARCKRDVAELRKELEPFESGALRTARRPSDGKWVDTTQHEIKMLKRAIASIQAVIAHHEGKGNR